MPLLKTKRMKNNMKKKIVVAVSTIALALLTGCASVPDNSGSNPKDPLETLNRQTFAFNSVLDEAIFIPLAKGYRFVTPKPVRESVTNFYQNLREPTNAVNNVLQGKVEDGILSLFRLMINSTVGVAGLFDVASKVDIEPKREDFGQTMGVWGIPSGPYLVLPILGPSDIRDAVGLVPEYFTDPNTYTKKDWIKWPVWGVQFVNARERLLPFTDMLSMTVDPYVAARDAFLSQRQSAIQDGDMLEILKPEEKLLDPFADDEPEEKEPKKEEK